MDWLIDDWLIDIDFMSQSTNAVMSGLLPEQGRNKEEYDRLKGSKPNLNFP